MSAVYCPTCSSMKLHGPGYFAPFHSCSQENVTLYNSDHEEYYCGPAQITEYRGRCVFGHDFTFISMHPLVQPKTTVPRPSNLYTVIDGFSVAAEDYPRRAVERKFRAPKPTFILED